MLDWKYDFSRKEMKCPHKYGMLKYTVKVERLRQTIMQQ